MHVGSSQMHAATALNVEQHAQHTLLPLTNIPLEFHWNDRAIFKLRRTFLSRIPRHGTSVPYAYPLNSCSYHQLLEHTLTQLCPAQSCARLTQLVTRQQKTEHQGKVHQSMGCLRSLVTLHHSAHHLGRQHQARE